MPAKAPIYLKPTNTKKGKKCRLRDILSPDLISPPLGDFRHTIHIGRGGQRDTFGDMSFLQGKYELLPGKGEPQYGVQSEFLRANSTGDALYVDTPSPVLKNAISLPTIGGCQALTLPLISSAVFSIPPEPLGDITGSTTGSTLSQKTDSVEDVEIVQIDTLLHPTDNFSSKAPRVPRKPGSATWSTTGSTLPQKTDSVEDVEIVQIDTLLHPTDNFSSKAPRVPRKPRSATWSTTGSTLPQKTDSVENVEIVQIDTLLHPTDNFSSKAPRVPRKPRSATRSTTGSTLPQKTDSVEDVEIVQIDTLLHATDNFSSKAPRVPRKPGSATWSTTGSTQPQKTDSFEDVEIVQIDTLLHPTDNFSSKAPRVPPKPGSATWSTMGSTLPQKTGSVEDVEIVQMDTLLHPTDNFSSKAPRVPLKPDVLLDRLQKTTKPNSKLNSVTKANIANKRVSRIEKPSCYYIHGHSNTNYIANGSLHSNASSDSFESFYTKEDDKTKIYHDKVYLHNRSKVFGHFTNDINLELKAQALSKCNGDWVDRDSGVEEGRICDFDLDFSKEKSTSQESLTRITGSLLSLELDLGPSIMDDVLNIMDKPAVKSRP
ncbi:cdc42 effector protein 3 [Nerophis lumbriciformis]|uniref:cdc42 effector protein 3 n=1 Tax=Nerophis lumbriciformis TaxID=546530 RepID=UPI002ADFE311|nr:uncharacterized protein LOC133607553 [Nerophis lumbriciformis]